MLNFLLTKFLLGIKITLNSRFLKSRYFSWDLAAKKSSAHKAEHSYARQNVSAAQFVLFDENNETQQHMSGATNIIVNFSWAHLTLTRKCERRSIQRLWENERRSFMICILVFNL